MKSDSYRPANCCNAADCDFLDEFYDDEREGPCWGQVEMDPSGPDDEDGEPLYSHTCRGHRHRYEQFEYGKSHLKGYYPEGS